MMTREETVLLEIERYWVEIEMKLRRSPQQLPAWARANMARLERDLAIAVRKDQEEAVAMRFEVSMITKFEITADSAEAAIEEFKSLLSEDSRRLSFYARALPNYESSDQEEARR